MEDFLKKLGIDYPLEKVSEEESKITLDKIDDIFKLYSKLENNRTVEEDSENSYIDIDEIKVTFYGDEYELELIGDMNNDEYNVLIRKIGDNNK